MADIKRACGGVLPLSANLFAFPISSVRAPHTAPLRHLNRVISRTHISTHKAPQEVARIGILHQTWDGSRVAGRLTAAGCEIGRAHV